MHSDLRPRDFLFYAIFLTLVAAVTPVHAYLDPGTGSFVLQMLLGGVAGAGLLIKVYWRKLQGVFARNSGAKTGAHDATYDEGAPERD
jgi:hypothetical protein